MNHTSQSVVTLSAAKRLCRDGGGNGELQRFFAALRMTSIGLLILLLSSARATADVSVTSSVDRNRLAFGESLTFSLNLMGTQEAPKGGIPKVDGLTFEGPTGDQSINNNGQLSRTISFRVTPASLGEFTIPAIEVEVGGKKYVTEPIKITVQKEALQEDLKDKLFGRVVFGVKEVFVGQVLPIQVEVFVRDGVPVADIGLPLCQGEGLRYQFLADRKLSQTVIDGVRFRVVLTDGAVSFSRPDKASLGSCALRTTLQFRSQARSLIEEVTGGHIENREVSVPVEAIPVEVLPLPEQGKPADFTGAVGQWNLEVTAKPTELAVGDPITLTVKISGNGNIDTVSTPQLTGLENFKTYDPTSKTTKNELSTTGERVFQQVLVPKSTEAKQLPEVRLAYFDPVAKSYKTAVQGPTKLVVKSGGGSEVVFTGAARARRAEKIGEDIVYLKGDPGPAAVATPFCDTVLFWVLNGAPVFALMGALAWKQRVDKLRTDVAYARRSRAAANARRLLAKAASYDDIQHVLQNYLGDRLNIPASGITSVIIDEQLRPRGVDGTLADDLRSCFERCDAARFAGRATGTEDVPAIRSKVERVINELESRPF